jgi:hypothetical protein
MEADDQFFWFFHAPTLPPNNRNVYTFLVLFWCLYRATIGTGSTANIEAHDMDIYEVETLAEFTARKQAAIADLIREHGTGVRPRWVSSDIAALTAEIKFHSDNA